MKKREQLHLYHTLFSLVEEDPRITPEKIAKFFRHSGRGKSPSTFSRHLFNMYRKKISKVPQLTLKSYAGAEICTYLCKRDYSVGLYSLIVELDKHPNINYAVALSSRRFFITSREEDLDLHHFGLNIEEVSKMFTPIYTIPRGWNLTMEDAFGNFLNSPFERGLLPRTFYYGLEWDELDWKIYDIMKRNTREKFTVVGRKVDALSSTVKQHFYNRILPCCILINYFFPNGRDSYRQVFLKIESDYESSIIRALEELPCTTYIFPLEKCIILGLFYESIGNILELIGKMEERAILDDYLLYNPLACTI